jgi:hypothetical protein
MAKEAHAFQPGFSPAKELMEPSGRAFVEEIAARLKKELEISDGAVGVDNYPGDTISAGIRYYLFNRVRIDLRHMTHSERLRIASLGIHGRENAQESGKEWEELHSGKTDCSMHHVHFKHPERVIMDNALSPEKHAQRNAATVILAAMYDLVVRKKNGQ